MDGPHQNKKRHMDDIKQLHTALIFNKLRRFFKSKKENVNSFPGMFSPCSPSEESLLFIPNLL